MSDLHIDSQTDSQTDAQLEQAVFSLVAAQRTGAISRRDFLARAAGLLGGAVAANGLWLASTGAPIVAVAAAMGALSPRPVEAADQATYLDLITATVPLNAFGSDTTGFLARPQAAGALPPVIVIQEWWGVDAHIKDVAARFARAGFVALAPDLYRGAVAQEPTDAQRLVMKVQIPQALNDIQTAINYLVAQPFSTPKQVGVIGFCFGGGIAMRMAYNGQHIGAVATLYGAGANPTDTELSHVTAPVIGFYGGQDKSVPADQIARWYTTLKADGIPAESHIYADAQHAFFNDTRSSYNKPASEDAWTRTLAWFRQYIPVERF